MALVIVIALAWLVILVPGYLRRRSANDETDSISHFHHQLRILEHSAPAPIVAPAYRLRGGHGDPVGAVGWKSPVPPTITVAGARDLPRPALAFLSDDGVLSDDGDDAAPGRPGSLPAPSAETGDRPFPPTSARSRSDAEARRQARQRRRQTLAGLVLAFVTLLMTGFVPGASPAFVAAGVVGVALAAYVAMLVRLRRVAEERDRKLRYLLPPATPADRAASSAPVGAFDSQFPEPRWAAR